MELLDLETREVNRAILTDLSRVYGGTIHSDFSDMLQHAQVTGNIEVVEEPGGVNNEESFGVFTEVWVDQYSVGNSEDMFEGCVWGKLTDDKWLKIPYSI